MQFRDITGALQDVAKGYHFHKTSPFIEQLREFVGKWVRIFNEWWRQLMSHSGNSLDSKSLSYVLQFFVVLAAVLAVIAAAYFLIKRMKHNLALEAQTIKGATSMEELLSASGWRTQASKLALTNDFRGACRAVYLSHLQELDENKIAKFAPTKTNYEYSYALSKHKDLQQSFRQLADLVEIIWFGNKHAQNLDYTQAMELLDSLSNEIKKAAPEGPTQASKEKLIS